MLDPEDLTDPPVFLIFHKNTPKTIGQLRLFVEPCHIMLYNK